MMHALRERSAKWNESKVNGTAVSFDDKLLNECAGATTLRSSKPASSCRYVTVVCETKKSRAAALRQARAASFPCLIACARASLHGWNDFPKPGQIASFSRTS